MGVIKEDRDLARLLHHVGRLRGGDRDQDPSPPGEEEGGRVGREDMGVAGEIIAIGKIRHQGGGREAEIAHLGGVEGVAQVAIERDSGVRVVNRDEIVVAVVMTEGGGAPEIHQIEGGGEGGADLAVENVSK